LNPDVSNESTAIILKGQAELEEQAELLIRKFLQNTMNQNSAAWHNNKGMMTVYFYQLMHKLFISIYLLYSSTCFEHYNAHFQEDKLY